MGLTLTGVDYGRVPRRTWIILACDGDHPLFDRPEKQFDCDPGAVEALRAATREGWLERHTRDGRKLWLCPDCRNLK